MTRLKKRTPEETIDLAALNASAGVYATILLAVGGGVAGVWLGWRWAVTGMLLAAVPVLYIAAWGYVRDKAEAEIAEAEAEQIREAFDKLVEEERRGS